MISSIEVGIIGSIRVPYHLRGNPVVAIVYRIMHHYDHLIAVIMIIGILVF